MSFCVWFYFFWEITFLWNPKWTLRPRLLASNSSFPTTFSFLSDISSTVKKYKTPQLVQQSCPQYVSNLSSVIILLSVKKFNSVFEFLPFQKCHDTKTSCCKLAGPCTKHMCGVTLVRNLTSGKIFLPAVFSFHETLCVVHHLLS